MIRLSAYGHTCSAGPWAALRAGSSGSSFADVYEAPRHCQRHARAVPSREPVSSTSPAWLKLAVVTYACVRHGACARWGGGSGYCGKRLLWKAAAETAATVEAAVGGSECGRKRLLWKAGTSAPWPLIRTTSAVGSPGISGGQSSKYGADERPMAHIRPVEDSAPEERRVLEGYSAGTQLAVRCETMGT